MRYIPDLTANVIVQVPEDKNAYINVRNIGASGRGDLEFTGRVTSVDLNGVVTIDSISDGSGGSIFQYKDLLRPNVDIQLFGYRQLSSSDPALITISGHEEVGNVNFSSSSANNPNLSRLTYQVTGYDVSRGTLVNNISTYQVGTKILNPDLWNTQQSIKLIFNRISGNILPIIYRSWGNNIKLLGVIGNNKTGYSGPGLSEFLDLGPTEIPFWESTPKLPEFLSNIISISGVQVELSGKLTAKETLTILPTIGGAQTSYLQCSTLSPNSGLTAGDSVRFVVDDTKFIRLSISTAASGQIKEVFFPSGTYNTRDTYFLNSSQNDFSDISLRGVGDATLIKRLPSTIADFENPGLINFTGQSGIRIKSMAFDGNRTETFSVVPPSESENTLYIRNCENVVVSDCKFSDNGGGGVSFYNTRGLIFTGNRIIRTGRAYEVQASPLLIDTGENVVVQSNQFEFATTGPKAISTEYSTISTNIIRACGDRGFVLETSSQWIDQGNLAYSDNDSLIRSIDTYNNEYSRATIEVRKGFALDPIYMTVTYGGESVSILKNSIKADIYQLDVNGVKTGNSISSFKILETSDQLEAGIFSITLPGGNTNIQTSLLGGQPGATVIATGNLDNPNGYMYEVYGDVSIGKFRPFSITPVIFSGNSYMAIRLQNSSDMLGFRIYSESDDSQNDRIFITNTSLEGWNQNEFYPILNIDTTDNSILIRNIPELGITETVQFTSGTLSILRPNYFIADGNLIVHSF